MVMERHEREAKARESLEQAAQLETDAWKLLSEDAAEDEIEDAVETALDLSKSEALDALVSNDGFRAWALLDWREDLGQEAEAEAKVQRTIVKQNTRKPTQTVVAFVVESIAHLNSDPNIKPYVEDLLIAAQVVRMATDKQLAAAVAEVQS